MPVSEYETWLLQIIENVRKKMFDNKTKADVDELAIGLDLSKDNSTIRAFALSNGITKAEWHQAIMRRRVSDILGAYPQNPSHLIKLFVEYDRVECSYDGALKQLPRTYKDHDGKDVPLNDADLAALDDRDRACVTVKIKTVTNLIDFILRIKVFAADHSIKFGDAAIENAVYYWYEEAQRDRLESIFMNVQYTVFQGVRVDEQKNNDLWRDLITRTCSCEDMSAEFVAAVLQKFIWQVKRKILNLPITGHLMPVLLGAQNAGKSMFVERLISPVAELVKRPDFGEIGDSRNIELWRSFVFFIDEMGKSSRADMDAIKNKITASILDARPMRSNKTVQVRNCATFIGNSNKAMEQLIIDPTGIRRFAPIDFLPMDLASEHWQYTSTFDFRRLWQGVNEHGPDPMIPFKDELMRVQGENQAYGPVENWLREFDVRAIRKVMHGDLILHKNLWENYSLYEDDNMPGAHKMPFTVWRAEIKRMLKTDHNGKKYPFINDRARRPEGMCFRYVGKLPETILKDR